MNLRRRTDRHVAVAVAASAVALLIAGCAATPTTEETEDASGIEEMEPVTLILSEPFPATNANNQGSSLFMEYVTEHTDGKVTFEVYDTSTLHTLPEAISAMQSGLSDITLYIPGLAAADVPAGGWATGLAAFTSDTPLDMLAGSPAATAAFQADSITAQMADNNAVILGNFTSDSYTLLCKEPLETLADAQGVLGRSSGGTYNPEMEALGMVPVLVDANEVYEALQRGTVECMVGALQNFVNSSLAEVAKYYTPLPFSPNTGAGYMMNKESWDALPPAAQEVFREASPLFGIGNNRTVIERYYEWYTKDMDEYDVTFVEPASDLATTLADFRTEQGDTLADRASEAGMEDPQATIDLFIEANDAWLKKLAEDFSVPEVDGTQESMLAALEYIVNEFDWEAYRQAQYDYYVEVGIWD